MIKTIRNFRDAVLAAADDESVRVVVEQANTAGMDVASICNMLLEAHIQNEKCVESSLPRRADRVLNDGQIARLQAVVSMVGGTPRDAAGEIEAWKQERADIHATAESWMPEFIQRNLNLAGGLDPGSEAAMEYLLEPMKAAVAEQRRKRLS